MVGFQRKGKSKSFSLTFPFPQILRILLRYNYVMTSQANPAMKQAVRKVYTCLFESCLWWRSMVTLLSRLFVSWHDQFLLIDQFEEAV